LIKTFMGDEINNAALLLDAALLAIPTTTPVA
jgi:hypothetical protein